MIKCGLCEVGEARVPVTASCCDSQACRLCAVQYLSRTHRCWAVDCGTPTEFKDLVVLSPSSSPVHCPLCSSLCRRAVTTPCCRAPACRPCAVKYLAATRTCWGEDCPKQLKWEDLETATELRAQVERVARGEEDSPRTREQQDMTRDMARASISPNKGHSLASAINLKLKMDQAAAILGEQDRMEEQEQEGLNGGQKREGEDDVARTTVKRSKYDQLCRTVGETVIVPGVPSNTVLVRLSLLPDGPEDTSSGRTVKISLSKHFLKHCREMGCSVEAQVFRRKLLNYSENSFAFIQVCLSRETDSSMLLAPGFHIANFSLLPPDKDPAVKEAPIQARPYLMGLLGDTVLTTAPKVVSMKVLGGEDECLPPAGVFLVTSCSTSCLEISSSLLHLDLNTSSTVDLELTASEEEEVELPAETVIAIALPCDSEEMLPRVLSKLGADGDRESEEEEERVRGLGEGERREMAEAAKLEGNTLFAAQKVEEALAKYSEAARLNPGDATFLSNRAACHLHLGHPELGLADARRATSLQPQYAKGWLRGLKCSIQLGDMVQAREMAEQVTKLSPGLKVLVEEEMVVISRVEKLQEELGLALGKEHYSQALHCLDQMAEACPQGRKIGVHRAEILAQKGNFYRCNEVLEQVFSQQENVEVFYIKGLVSYYKDQLPDVFLHLTRVLEIEPSHHKAKRILGRAIAVRLKKDECNTLYNGGKHEEAHTAYTEALAIDKLNTLLNAKLYFWRATNAAKLNRLSDTVDDCTSAVQLDKGYTEAFVRRAQCFMEMESYDEAVKDFEQATRLEPKNIEYGKMLSEASEKLRNSKNKDFYALLGVTKTATAEEIKKAYRKAALTHHPDRHSSADEKMKDFHEKKFKSIGEAYGVLSDDVKRKQYDQGTLYRAIQASTAQHFAAAAAAAAQAQASLLAQLATQHHLTNLQRQMRIRSHRGGMGMGGLMGVGPRGQPGGLNPAWLSGVAGVPRVPGSGSLPSGLLGFPPGAGLGAAGLSGLLGSQGLLGGLPGGAGLLGAGLGGRPQLNPRFPGYRY